MIETFSTKANQTSTAMHNRRLTLSLLREHGPLSRWQLAQITGLRSSTLTYIVRELIDARLVRTVGKRKSNTVGKKQILLEINPDLGWVVGAGIDRDTVSLSFMNAAGRVIDRQRFDSGHRACELPGRVAEAVRAWARGSGESMENLLGIGIGTPGVVDAQRGVLLRSTWLKAEDFPFGQRLREIIDVPVLIDNDANCAALAEYYRGSARGLANFVYFFVSSQEMDGRLAIYGLGSTCFLNHTLYRGTHFGAGEVDSVLESNRIEYTTYDELLRMAEEDAELTPELNSIAYTLARPMASVGNLLDPQAIILGGNVTIRNRQMIETIERALNHLLVPLPNRYVEVRSSRFTDRGTSVGAAMAAIEAVNVVDSPSHGEARVMPLMSRMSDGLPSWS